MRTIERILGCLLALVIPALSQQGYQQLADELLVNTEAHWQAWETPTGVRVLPLVDVRVDGYLRLSFTSP